MAQGDRQAAPERGLASRRSCAASARCSTCGRETPRRAICCPLDDEGGSGKWWLAAAGLVVAAARRSGGSSDERLQLLEVDVGAGQDHGGRFARQRRSGRRALPPVAAAPAPSAISRSSRAMPAIASWSRALVDEHDTRHQPADDVERDRVGIEIAREAVGERGAHVDRDDAAGGEALRERGRRLDFDADDRDAVGDGPRGDRDRR